MQKEYLGVGSLRELSRIIKDEGYINVFLVTGKHSFGASGAKVIIEEELKMENVQRFDDFSPNPSIEDIKKGIAFFKEAPADVIIAIGGGSVMDVAKAINALAFVKEDLADYVAGKEKLKGVAKPLIAVPTTGGSGSEATHFAVVYIKEQKYSLAHESILPDVAIVDPTLTYSLPARSTASCGFDALSQSIESYWSVSSTDESKNYAKKAIPLALENIVRAVEGDKEARNAMSEAAHLAGKAINVSKTTASHAMSYPLTVHFGVSHGHAVFLTLPSVLLFNSGVIEEDAADERGVGYVREVMTELLRMLGTESSEEAKEKLTSLVERAGLETRLSDLNITEKDVDLLLKSISAERAGNNPRKFSKDVARGILISIM